MRIVECLPDQHQWKYRGVSFRNSGERLAGSSATTIEYFDVYFCASCLKVVREKVIEKDSYQEIKYNATPLPPNSVERTVS